MVTKMMISTMISVEIPGLWYLGWNFFLDLCLVLGALILHQSVWVANWRRVTIFRGVVWGWRPLWQRPFPLINLPNFILASLSWSHLS